MSEEPEHLIPHLLREMRQEMNARFDKIDERLCSLERAVGELKTDVKEVSLATVLLEVRMSKVADRLDRIEKHLGLVKA